MAAVSFIVLRHQYGRRDVMFKYVAPAREQDFKYLLFDTPSPAFPQLKPAFNQSLLQKGIYISSHGSTRARYHPAKPEVLNHYLYLFFLVGWQISWGIFWLGLSALFSTGPCGSSSSLMEKHGMLLSKNHAYVLFCQCFPLSLLSFIEIEVLQVILLIWCLKSVKCGREFTYRLWHQASYWSMFITRNMFIYPLFVVGAVWF